uniref:EIF3g domain-containing protein n=1 Tax=Caenorhabditis tropicalis TaxID=1561998 RepID=A0A1I7TT77_9PELO
MAKRPATVATEVKEEAKKMAITFQMKTFMDQAAKALTESRPPPKCKMCHENHFTSDCTKKAGIRVIMGTSSNDAGSRTPQSTGCFPLH